jgi:hypothetical protein
VHSAPDSEYTVGGSSCVCELISSTAEGFSILLSFLLFRHLVILLNPDGTRSLCISLSVELKNAVFAVLVFSGAAAAAPMCKAGQGTNGQL